MGGPTHVFGSRDGQFFDLFEAAGANVAQAAVLLAEMLGTWPDGHDLHGAIVDCEHEGDRITHAIIRRLNETDVTPIDRQDSLELASALDDVVDYVEEVADFLGLYRIEAPMEQSQHLAELLVDAARNVSAALGETRQGHDIGPLTVEVNRLENEGDRVSREAIASLFEGGIDPMVVIRWKDIYERLEQAIDACEHVANVLEGVVIRSS
jgi:predicted phosphate transport protein (TIGR00153 family)